jgi:hypothetical protein
MLDDNEGEEGKRRISVTSASSNCDLKETLKVQNLLNMFTDLK